MLYIRFSIVIYDVPVHRGDRKQSTYMHIRPSDVYRVMSQARTHIFIIYLSKYKTVLCVLYMYMNHNKHI